MNTVFECSDHSSECALTTQPCKGHDVNFLLTNNMNITSAFISFWNYTTNSIQNRWLFAAGVASAFTALIHVFLGGPEIAVPLLLAKDIADVPKYVNYYCWHIVSITITAMAVGFMWASVDVRQTGLAWSWTVVALLYTLWSVLLIVMKQQNALHMPQWVLFGIISMLGVMGVMENF